jgi:redox-sensitive bicupin YhaK (pirin superfamily)
MATGLHARVYWSILDNLFAQVLNQMTLRTIQQLVRAQEITEGAGVTVYRTLGTPALRNLDPFLMLDHFSSNRPDEYIAGFPPHPHRGFITLTYMLDGHMRHEDSMGNRGDLLSGGIQWMKAASGVIHSEMPEQTDGLMRGFQLWINLPAAEKMGEPAYQDFAAAQIPLVEPNGMRVKIISGSYAGQQGPVDDPHTRVNYLDVSLPPEQLFRHTLAAGANAFIYPFEGDLVIAGTHVAGHTLVVLTAGEQVEITAGSKGVRFIFLAGMPIGEAIVQHGPFVMNTMDEIKHAIDDYNNQRLVRRTT